MKKNFILLLSAMLLTACGGNKQQSSASEEAVADTIVENECSEYELPSYLTVGDESLEAIEGVDYEELAMAKEFLSMLQDPGEEVDIYSDEWIQAHCTPEVQQFLRDQYDFDGEGYAMWLFDGRFPGQDEYETTIYGIGYGMRHGQPVYDIEKAFTFYGEPTLVRHLYFGLKRNGDDFIITSFSMNLSSEDPTVNYEEIE